MTVLYLPITNGHDEEINTIPYNVIQDLLMNTIDERELQDDRHSQRKIS